MKKNESGFSAVETILLLVVVIALAGVGYYVYKAKKNTTSTYNSAANASTTTKPAVKTTTTDPTASWKSFTSTAGKFSLKYPSNWVTETSCLSNQFWAAPTAASLGQCGSSTVSEITVIGSTTHGCFPLDSTFSNVTSETVTISGVQGTKYSGVVNSAQDASFGPVGTKVEQYCVSTSAVHYTASYNQLAGYPDASSDFNLIVTKMLTFN